MDEQTIQTYDSMAVEYDSETADFWDRFPRTILNEFTKRIGKGLVADIGSGPGRDGLIIQKSGCDVVCLDASQVMVDMCIQKGLKAVKGNLLETPFKDHEFDGVWAYTSFLHVPKKSMSIALSEVRRILKPGGTFGLGLIEGEGESYRTSSGVNKPRLFAYYTKDEIEDLLDKAGFTVQYFDLFKPGSKSYLNYIAKVL